MRRLVPGMRGAGLQPERPRSRARLSMATLPHTDPTSPAPVHLNEPLLTADDVAALLAVPRSTVYEYARRLHDPLPSLAVGRHRRFYRSDIERWLSHQRP